MSAIKFEFDSTSMEELLKNEIVLDDADVKSNSVITGKVVSIEKDIDEPYVLLALPYKADGKVLLSDLDTEPKIGEELEALVYHLEESSGLLILSVRRLKQRIGWSLIESSFEKELSVYGTIKRKVNGGFLVDVSSILLFLPFTELGHYPKMRENQDHDSFPEDEIALRILELDVKKKRGLVSRKKIQEEEKEVYWKKFAEIHQQGSIVHGKIVHIINVGVFVEKDKVTGFVHNSNISWSRSNTEQKKSFSVGQDVSVYILEIDVENRRLSLGIKQTLVDPWTNIEEHISVGQVQTGKVQFVAKYGAFFDLSEDLEGLLHVSEMSWVKNYFKMSDLLKVGEEVQVKVVGVNKEEKKISLSVRELTENPWLKIKNDYKVGDTFKGNITRMFKSGLFVSFEENLEAFIKKEDLTWEDKYSFTVLDNFKKTQEISFKITEINLEKKCIYGSHRACLENPYKIFKEQYKMGSILDAIIASITSFGLFLSIEGVPMDALVPMRFIPKEKSTDLRKHFQKKEKIQVCVKYIDVENEKITLSITDVVTKLASQEIRKYITRESELEKATFSPFAELGNFLEKNS